MRKLLLVLVFAFSSGIFSQNLFEKEIVSLSGFESETGVTHLIYGTNGGYIHSTKLTQFDYHHYNTANRTDSVIFSGFMSQPPSYPIEVGELVGEFGFFDKDPSKYIYIKNYYDMDVHGKIIKYDNPSSYSSFYPLQHLWIDKNDQNICYTVTENFVIKSTNRGNDWGGTNSTPSYGIQLSFEFVSGNPYNGAMIFGLDNYNHLCRSVDSGKTYNIVLNSNLGGNTKIYYDINKKTIYATNGFNLYVSDNYGNDGSWQWKRTFAKSIKIATDGGTSGKLCIASGSELFISSNYGESFTLLKRFERNIKGIYKKPGISVIFIAFKNKIIAIDEYGNNYPYYSWSFNLNKYLSMYPLQVGNTWVYKTEGEFFDPIDWHTYVYYNKTKIVGEEYFNNIKYFKFSDGTYSRIDSLNGRVYKKGSANLNEQLLYDLYAEDGDSINIDNDRGILNSININDTLYFNNHLIKKRFNYNSLFIQKEELLQNFGLIYSYKSYDFGYDSTKLMGCVINGTLYGDTTLVSVNEPINVTKFELSQNYPNPFNPSTIIKFSLPEGGNVKLIIYDVLGRRITELINEYKSIGEYSVLFQPQKYGLASGVYCYQLITKNNYAVKKMIYSK